MVRAIIEHCGGETLYGTREAVYFLALDSEERINNFATELNSNIARINRDIGYDYGVFLSANGKSLNDRDKLDKALYETPNIHLRFKRNGGLVANLISRFSDSSEEDIPRTLSIPTIGIPNSIMEFDASFLYELGEKHGKIMSGVDFDISIGNYREINNF
ncbi:MAG: hypothetical protein OEL87_02010 [Nanoarchaeota archaeon]|nr:hypothetical protein [Nanoarchaeota archaeon]